jgi:hypothetical protein
MPCLRSAVLGREGRRPAPQKEGRGRLVGTELRLALALARRFRDANVTEDNTIFMDEG